jgi:hypothetical protein
LRAITLMAASITMRRSVSSSKRRGRPTPEVVTLLGLLKRPAPATP